MKVLRRQSNSRMCFICGLDNPIGLRAPFYEMEDGSVMTRFRYGEAHQSFPGRVHGGLVATMHDELGLRAMWVRAGEDTLGVTMDLRVQYRKPVPYGEDLIARGIVTKLSKSFAAIETAIYDLAGNRLSNAEMKYLIQPASRIAAGADSHEEMCYRIEDGVSELPFFTGV